MKLFSLCYKLGAREVNPRQKSFRPGLGALRQNGQLRGRDHQGFWIFESGEKVNPFR